MGSSQHDASSFLANMHSADWDNIVYVFVGGVIFNVANILLVAGIGMAGLAVAFPVSIGIALVEGVLLSYALQPKGNAMLLGAGVLFALIAVVLDGLAYGKLPRQGGGISKKSLVVCIISGLLMGAFAPFVTRALTVGHTLNPYSIAVIFTIGAFVCCLPVNTYLMRRPLVGAPVSFSDYFAARGTDHLLGFLGGCIWGLGTTFNFVAASFTGVAISYAIGQASPMVAALWGVFVWKEFSGASGRAKTLLALMFLSYLLALFLVAQAYRAAG
jgi:glucose uptake protein